MRVAGFTSTGSKRPAALFGADPPADLPARMTRSAGARVWDGAGREYLDFLMALGAVSLGYRHPAVTAAAREAIERGGVGPLPPEDEERLAARLHQALPWLERIRFLKTGAEAVAAAVRLARTATGRDRVVGCGYHGWLDLSSVGDGIPGPVAALYQAIPFNHPDRARDAIRKAGDALAAVVVEPVVDGPPTAEWLQTLRDETSRVGAVLVLDEVKTGFRVALGGAVERWQARPDLVVYGKALGNGFPIAAVGGPRTLLDQVERTWISSTLATEFVALAAARAAVDVTVADRVPERLGRLGGTLRAGLGRLAAAHPRLVTGVLGIDEMCHLGWTREDVGIAVARGMARRGVLFKRTGYNFVSAAHTEADLARCLALLEETLAEVGAGC